MIPVQFPAPQFRLKKKGEKQYIFDTIRKTWLLLTGEEWVRQNFVAFLTAVLGYPKEAIALEKEIRLNGMKKRFDILVYNGLHQPWMMIECKAPQVSLSEEVLQQLLRYHLSMPVSWMVITNGNGTIAWSRTASGLLLTESWPAWQQ